MRRRFKARAGRKNRKQPVVKPPPAADEIAILEALNRGLEITDNPYAALAAETRLDENHLLRKIRKLIRKGLIGNLRFVLNHTKLGIAANSMVAWNISDERKEKAGKYFAGKDFISHCYERKRLSEFPYNIYTMMHAKNQEELDLFISALAREISPISFQKLATISELTKKRASLAPSDYRII